MLKSMPPSAEGKGHDVEGGERRPLAPICGLLPNCKPLCQSFLWIEIDAEDIEAIAGEQRQQVLRKGSLSRTTLWTIEYDDPALWPQR
jgi:hypothetical protein